jgi:mRNA-degrading endonuclease RelE of RelBE toxin-antitoxin system
MNLEFIYRKKVDKFFSKNSHLLDKSTARELLIKAVKRILLKEDINIDVKKLKGELHHLYRIRQNKIRIVFEIINNEIVVQLIVEDIDFRGNVYE